MTGERASIGRTRLVVVEANREDKVLPLDLPPSPELGGCTLRLYNTVLSSGDHRTPSLGDIPAYVPVLNAAARRARASCTFLSRYVCSCLPLYAFIRLDIRQNLYYIPSNVRTWWTPRLHHTNRPNLRIFAYVAFAAWYCHKLGRSRFSQSCRVLLESIVSRHEHVQEHCKRYSDTYGYVREISEDLVRSKGAWLNGPGGGDR